MPHDTTLIATIVGGLVLAFALGFVADRFRLPPLVGYLLAGVAVGPHTPGFVADTGLALQLAEIGVILLMFAVGLHFSIKDLLVVRKIAVPGAVVQIATATAIGTGLAYFWGGAWAAAWCSGWPFPSPAPSSSCGHWRNATHSTPTTVGSPSAG